jgi:hypothetical protein
LIAPTRKGERKSIMIPASFAAQFFGSGFDGWWEQVGSKTVQGQHPTNDETVPSRPVSGILSAPDTPWRTGNAAAIHLGRRLPDGSCDLYPGTSDGPSVPLFGLAPGGVYKAPAVTGGPGELLPHRFTLTATEAAAVYSLLHFPRLATGRR